MGHFSSISDEEIMLSLSEFGLLMITQRLAIQVAEELLQ